MMTRTIQDIGCVVMASGLSARYGRNKLLEDLGGKAVVVRVVDSLRAAGLAPVVVTRSDAVAALAERAGARCSRTRTRRWSAPWGARRTSST